MKKLHEKRTEFWLDLQEMITNTLIELGVDQDKANVIACIKAEAFTMKWASSHLYIPKNTWAATEEKRRQIRAEFTGNNHAELAEKHGVHIRTIYKVLKQK